jgi:hypothetical protein
MQTVAVADLPTLETIAGWYWPQRGHGPADCRGSWHLR